LGVEVGLSIAANHPDRVLSLVCDGGMFNESGPYGLWEGTDEEFQAHALERVEKLRTTPPTTYPTVDDMVAANRKVFEEMGWWSDGYEAVIRYGAVQQPDGQFSSGWGHIAEDYTKHYLHNRLEDYYSKLQCPVLMLPDTYPGQDDREKEIMHAMFEMVGKGKIVAVPEWVHPFGWMITPEAVSQVILEFLSEVNSM
jgi:2-succinyl-6-hydroxy-2,4-cyclohexadiene-1-carboxylate synthase